MKSLRQKNIITMLEQNLIVNTAELATYFDVSIETIRRDLDQLEKQGVLKKTYGGAELKTQPHIWPAPLKKRMESFRDSKAAIAARAATYIPDNATVALDAGTTILELCPFLNEKENMILISSDVHSSTELLSAKSNKVYMMGGFLTPDGTSSGSYAKEFLSSISDIDIFFTATDGASLEDGLSTDEANINELKKRYIKKAKKVIALVDHSKFFRKGFYRLCDFAEIDVVITDSKTPAEIIAALRRTGTTVDVVDVNGE